MAEMPTLVSDTVPEWYDNFTYNGVAYRRSLYSLHRVSNIIPNLDLRETDLLLSTFPRSGTIWTKFIVACLYNKDNLDVINKKSLGSQIEWLDTVEADIFFGTNTEQEQLNMWMNTNGPRLFNSHFLWKNLPAGIREGKCKVILVVRNPKDVVVSMYKMMSSIRVGFTFEGSFDEFFSAFMTGKIAWGNVDYFTFYKSWWEKQNEIPMLMVYYEDMKRDLANEIRRIAAFIAIDVEDDDIRTIAKLSGFDEMRTAPCVAGFDDYMLKTSFFRKGEVGNWKNYLTVAQSEEMDEMMKTKMDGTGFLVKYE